MVRPKKIKEELTPVVEVVRTETPVKAEPVVRSAEYLRVKAVYEDFKAKYPDKWEREKEVLLAKLNNL